MSNTYFIFLGTEFSSMYKLNEASGVRHDSLYSVDSVWIACSGVNITVFGYCQIFMKGFI